MITGKIDGVFPDGCASTEGVMIPIIPMVPSTFNARLVYYSCAVCNNHLYRIYSRFNMHPTYNESSKNSTLVIYKYYCCRHTYLAAFLSVHSL